MQPVSNGHKERVDGPRLAAGELIADRFVIDRLIGVGGMGAVYRAQDLKTRLPAALKVMAAPGRSEVGRFAREAQVLAGLSHPAIVRYLAHGVTSCGTDYLAMEWLEGSDLSERLARGGLKVEESLELVRRLCGGLALAHTKGIVHRDIKPSNIFLVDGAAENAKLLDFGVARYAAATRTLTRAGSVLGTIGYMAPEQAMGLPQLDARADVFALGCVLFECITGQPAFAAQHEIAVLAKVLRDDPSKISELRPGLGGALDELVGRLLAKDREQRPADAAALQGELEKLGALVGEVPVTRTRARKPLIESEQRIVTVILAQPVRNCAQTLPVEEARQNTAELDALCWTFRAEQVPLHGGSMLLVLGASSDVTASDQAAQAARCALRLRERRPELVLAVATGSMDASGRIPVGAAIDRAAALLSRTSGETPMIALDQLTAALLGARFDVQRRDDELALAGEIEIFEAPRLLMGRRTPFVGRTKELALLDATLRECTSDQVARVILVTAAPGIGKSRLAHEYVEQVRAQASARVLIARAEPYSAGSPLRLIRRLIRSAAALLDSEPAASQQAQLRDYLTALVPAGALERMLEFIGELVGVPTETPSPLLRAARNDHEVMREQSRRAFESWMDAESTRRPLVLLFDDLQWADPPSVAYVEELLAAWENRSILVVALARPEVHERFPRLFQAAGVQEIPLRGLTQRAGERLTRAILSPELLARIERRIIDLADGNAFYLEELIRRAAEGRTEFPETVLAMVQSRIDALPVEERRILRAASVFGETFWAGSVEALLGVDDCGTCLDSLVEHEILVRRAQARFSGEREYAFRHAFLRDAAYAMLPLADREMAHGMAGDWLEKVGETDARMLADHFERGDTKERAIPWIVKAALAAVDAGDIEGARVLSARGLSLGATASDRGTLLLVDEYMAAWNAQSDLQRLREAIDLLPQASAHWWLAVSTLIFCSSATGHPDAAAPYLELALNTAPGTELTGFRGLALQSVASGTILMGRTDIGWWLLERFEDVGLDDARCDQIFAARLMIARSHLGIYSPINGKWQLQTALEWARASTAAMDAAGSASGEMTALFILGCVWLFLGAYAEAEATLRKSLEHAKRKGNQLVEHYSQLVLAWVILRQGRFDEAESWLHPIFESWDLNLIHGAHAVQAEGAYLAGRFEAALAQALSATEGPAVPYRRMAWATVARAQLALGNPQGALKAVSAAASDGNIAPNLEFEIDLRTTRAQALTQLGDLEDARAELHAAQAFLAEVANNISDPELREGFVTRVRAHALLHELAAAVE